MRVEKSEHAETSDIQVTLEKADIAQILAENPETADDKEFAQLEEFTLWFNEHGAPTGVCRGKRKRKAKPSKKDRLAVVTSQAALIHSIGVAHPHALEILRLEREAKAAQAAAEREAEKAKEGKTDA